MSAHAEWLETDGLGGFASGCVSGAGRRRYHALLLVAQTPPTQRVVLVNGFEAWVESADGRWPLTTHRYHPDVTAPDAAPHLMGFTGEPWPTWTYRLPTGIELTHEIVLRHGAPVVGVTWQARRPCPGFTLCVRPFLSARDIHALHVENPAFRFESLVDGQRVMWHPYADLPAIVSIANGVFIADPQWYRGVQYDEERERGYDHVEDLASPGVLRFDLSASAAAWVMAADGLEEATDAAAPLASIQRSERTRRSRLGGPLERAADDYLVRRGNGTTIIAGYPWFGDWGRDTFVSVRGLAIATGRLDDARDVLMEWAGHVSQGMLPNRFPGRGEAPEYNSVDASLWYIVAVHDLMQAGTLSGSARRTLCDAAEAILAGYVSGTRYGIRADSDGLLAAGEPGVQLTWMDARVGDQVITPRIGKPVEVQALWINALRAASAWSDQWGEVLQRAERSFRPRFWREDVGYCYDVVDVDHEPGRVDASFRPNQLFPVGGLPFPLLDCEDGRRLVDAVEARLMTPLGPRSLAPDDPAYVGRYAGGVADRDGAYHQGTVWPWLAGAFIDAWVRVRGATTEARETARARFVGPLMTHLSDAGMRHVSEVADGDPPHHPGGCPFQAWSIAELLRVERTICAR